MKIAHSRAGGQRYSIKEDSYGSDRYPVVPDDLGPIHALMFDPPDQRSPYDITPAWLDREFHDFVSWSDGDRAVLLEACRTVDICDRLSASAASIDKPAPILTELRQQRATLTKLLNALGLPKGVAADDESKKGGPFHVRRGSTARRPA